jgi:integrase
MCPLLSLISEFLTSYSAADQVAGYPVFPADLRSRHSPSDAVYNAGLSMLTERFPFRDLLAKSASDDTAEAASKRLGHADSKITERAYRRKAERAKPLR